MYNAIFAEFLKLKRSRMLFFVALAGMVPALVKLLQSLFGQSGDQKNWIWFVASKREISMLLLFVAIVMSAAFLFSMEYRYGTASYLFTSNTSRIKLFLSKLFAQCITVVLIMTVQAASDLLFGLAAIGNWIPAGLFEKYLAAYLWQILLYGFVSAIVAMIAIYTKKFVLSVILVFGYLILVFPWHLKGNVFILPFMTPTVTAARAFGTENYIYSSYYAGTNVELAAAVLFLAGIAAISSLIGMAVLKRQQLAK